MEVQPYVGNDQRFDPNWMEHIILHLCDAFEIRIAWDRDTALISGVCALAGGLVGSYAGGRLGAVLGAGIGSVTGLGVSTMVLLREIWVKVKDQLQELLYIVFNFMRTLDPIDYLHAFEIFMASRASRRELVFTIVEFVATKLGREVISRIALA